MMASNLAPPGQLPQEGLGLSQAELRALEQTRFRLQNLSNSLASFKQDLFTHKPLPNPQSLQTSASILKHHTNYLLENLSKHSALFQRLAVHPNPSYPGRTQENVVQTLLRKKLEPDIETLVEAARDEALAAGITPTESFVSQEGLLAQREREKAERRQAKFGFGGDEGDEDSSEEEEGGSGASSGSDDEGGERVNEPIGLGDVWVDSLSWLRERLKGFAQEFETSLYTAEERAMGVENVRTGLKRSLEEEEESDDEDESDEEEDGEGDTAMRDMQPIAPSSGQPAGQHGMNDDPESTEAKRRMPAIDELRMVSLLARGENPGPQAMQNSPMGHFQQR